jgi:hypothetical protein
VTSSSECGDQALNDGDFERSLRTKLLNNDVHPLKVAELTQCCVGGEVGLHQEELSGVS